MGAQGVVLQGQHAVGSRFGVAMPQLLNFFIKDIKDIAPSGLVRGAPGEQVALSSLCKILVGSKVVGLSPSAAR